MALPSPVKKKEVISKRLVKENENMSPQELQKFMNKHGFSEQDFADFLGVTVQGVNLWLSGERTFSVTNSRLIKLLDKHSILIREF
jgi:DNA-binding transcriptional regulator YiaG